MATPRVRVERQGNRPGTEETSATDVTIRKRGRRTTGSAAPDGGFWELTRRQKRKERRARRSPRHRFILARPRGDRCRADDRHRLVVRPCAHRPRHGSVDCAQRRVVQRSRRPRHREPGRALVVHESPAACRRQARARAPDGGGARGRCGRQEGEGAEDAGRDRPARCRRTSTHRRTRSRSPIRSRTRGSGIRPGAPCRGCRSVYTTFMRPDPVHTSLVTGLAWMDTKLLRTVFVPGLQEPGGGPNPGGPRSRRTSVPVSCRRSTRDSRWTARVAATTRTARW